MFSLQITVVLLGLFCLVSINGRYTGKNIYISYTYILVSFFSTFFFPIPKACGPYQYYNPCGPACDTRCDTLGKPCMIMNVKCPSKCYCQEGYARDSSENCIPKDDCSTSYSFVLY